MCEYSLHNVASRPAQVADRLTVRDFGTGTRGFAASEDANVVVCVLPGTELAFAAPLRSSGRFGAYGDRDYQHCTAVFRQVDQDRAVAHHDALELPNGAIVKLTVLAEGQTATVLQLPAAPPTAAAAKAQQRLLAVG